MAGTGRGKGGATRLFAGAGLEVAGLEVWLEARLETGVETKRGGGDVPEAGMGRDVLRGMGTRKQRTDWASRTVLPAQ